MAWERVRIVIIRPVGNPHYQSFQEVAETLADGFKLLGVPTTLSENAFEDGAENVVLGWHLLAETPGVVPPPGSILYNLEQMDDLNSKLRARLTALAPSYRIWDYSQRNLDLLRAQGLTAPITLVPIGSTPHMCRIQPAPVQDLDVLFYGSVNERRRKILLALQDAGVTVGSYFGVFGAQRDALIARAKLVLNLHYYDASIFEMVRVSYLLANRKAVVAERNPGTELDAGLEGAARLVPYDGLVEACLELLKDGPGRRALEEAGHAYMMGRDQSAILRGVLEAEGVALPAPAAREAFLFEPDWQTAGWVEVLLAYLEAFAPGEPVGLVLPMDPARKDQLTLEEGQGCVMEIVRATGREAFPDVILVSELADLPGILKGFATIQQLPGEGAWALKGPNGARFSQARGRLLAAGQ